MLLILSITASAKEEFYIAIEDVREHDEDKDMNDGFNGNELVDMDVYMSNLGNQIGCMKVECGIYKRADVNKWYAQPVFFAVTSVEVENCKPYEPNVDTRYVCLKINEETTQTFTVKAPSTSWFTSHQRLTEEYGIHCQAFENCWKAGVNVGQTDFAVEPIALGIDISQIKEEETCFDGMKNQDETSVDCGGDTSDCRRCIEEEYCEKDGDCQDGLECTKGWLNKLQCQIPEDAQDNTGPYPPDPQPPVSCGNGKVESGESCVNCPQDFAESYCIQPLPNADDDDDGVPNQDDICPDTQSGKEVDSDGCSDSQKKEEIVPLLGIGAGFVLVIIIVVAILVVYLKKE